MSGIDSPIGRCEKVREMVLLDETQGECACEHGCPPGQDCPLEGHFAQVSGMSDATAESIAAKMKQAK
ncbi:MAG TPA: hypothetical protein PK620_06365 [Denitromonas sp.]|uniref:hypothetical protein n=1 Tax=Denitromonas sp. TaxID=2734609 RepID=UPI001E10746A|nr:hypothetical protein [Rhodocyclaceae bacterium]MCP5220759.1 hypothetical protein [Zoogloeaceae bacterium]HQU88143.1 hypothetical protein [Denitromonas sp.]HQV14520.1 hypothetical protein [Denitromonas sp.]